MIGVIEKVPMKANSIEFCTKNTYLVNGMGSGGKTYLMRINILDRKSVSNNTLETTVKQQAICLCIRSRTMITKQKLSSQVFTYLD